MAIVILSCIVAGVWFGMKYAVPAYRALTHK